MASSSIAIAKEKSIIGYIKNKGILPEKKGSVWFIRSPFSDERRPSFVIYEATKSFYDFSTGTHGDILDLVMLLEKLSLNEAITFLIEEDQIGPHEYSEKQGAKENKFNILRYLQFDWREKVKIKAYANFRKIPNENYIPGCLSVWNDNSNSLEYKNALIFPHQNKIGVTTGIKARLIYDNDIRFTARGKLGFYVLQTKTRIGAERLYIVESETSANALYQFLKSIQVNATILSFGGVHQSTKIELPERFCNLLNRYIVIDYDGNEELYHKRIQNFKHLNCKNVKIEVKKGDDISSLYMNGMIEKYIHKFLN